jgi:hypothetical protein
MNSSLIIADGATHLKIMIVALLAAFAVVALGAAPA